MVNPKRPHVDLPDRMPASWVDQLKQATRPALWTIILGSSVIAGIISGGFSIYTQSNLKVRTEVQSRRATKAQDAYGVLSQDSHTLLTRLMALKAMLQIRSERHLDWNPYNLNELQKQEGLLGESSADLLKDSENPFIDDIVLKTRCGSLVQSFISLLQEQVSPDQLEAELKGKYQSLESDINGINGLLNSKLQN